MWSSLPVTCGRSVVFSGYIVSSINKTDRHDTTEILSKVALKHHNPKLLGLNDEYIYYSFHTLSILKPCPLFLEYGKRKVNTKMLILQNIKMMFD